MSQTLQFKTGVEYRFPKMKTLEFDDVEIAFLVAYMSKLISETAEFLENQNIPKQDRDNLLTVSGTADKILRKSYDILSVGAKKNAKKVIESYGLFVLDERSHSELH